MTKRSDTNYTIPKGLSRDDAAAFEAAALKTGGNFWPGKDPEPGAYLIGEFVSQVEIPNKMGGKGATQRKYTLQTDDGPRSFFGATILDSEMDSAAPQVGDRICILFKGYLPKKGKRKPAKLFSVTRVEVKGKRR